VNGLRSPACLHALKNFTAQQRTGADQEHSAPARPPSSAAGVVVTLFLALAAVQFVISEHQPSSSYVLPTQQQVRFGALRGMRW
jgi:hypothetical protein